MADAAYREIVASFKEHILAGDIFQGVPSRRVVVPRARRRAPDLPAAARLEPRARTCSTCGRSGWSSPARRRSRSFASRAGACSTRPIAGTRPRGLTEVRDRLLEHELLADPKEQAEHAMLVDLARNDLGRVCVPGLVRPTELMVVERFSKVMHIVSTVEGDLRAGRRALRRARGDLPGRDRHRRAEAPRDGADRRARADRRAARTPGAVGYLTFAGDLDFCITIRTAVGGRRRRERPGGRRRRRRLRPRDRARARRRRRPRRCCPRSPPTREATR